MSLFYLLLCLMVLGFGAIAFVITMEKRKEAPGPNDSKKPAPAQQLSPNDLLDRLGLDSASKNNPNPAKNIPLPEFLKKAALIPAKDAPSTSQFIPVAAPSPADTKAESELSLKYDELLTEHKELQEKLTKMEVLFAEKSSTLEKSEKTLSNELKNQKEFNKIKDLLEKEIKESKEKVKMLQADVTNAQTEAQTYLKRIGQLEEKVKKLEVEVLTSEAAINDGQAGIQLARKHAAELEEKLRANENVILEKNQKIEDLVNRLNLHPATNDLKAIAETVAAQEPGPEIPAPVTQAPQEQAVPAPEATLEQAPAPIPKQPVNEPLPVPEPSPQPEPAVVMPVPEPPAAEQLPTVPVTEPQAPEPTPSENVVEEGGGATEEKTSGEEQPAPQTEPQKPENSNSGETLSLPPDIFANPKKEEPPQGETP
ncbi:MAG: hypothetical protein IT395_07805 [Candidatus Omnitrophica bacterium]|nr:hypothetical protein [Candidatus Omnitrophota bacterium]